MLENFVSFESYFFAIHSLVGLKIMKKNILFKNINWFNAILPLVFLLLRFVGLILIFVKKFFIFREHFKKINLLENWAFFIIICLYGLLIMKTDYFQFVLVGCC